MVPMDAAVIPLPIEETTPPVTKTSFGTGTLFSAARAPAASRIANPATFDPLGSQPSKRGKLKTVYPYGLIGNCETAALVSASGAIDWFCYPRFDSPSIFASILDRHRVVSFST